MESKLSGQTEIERGPSALNVETDLKAGSGSGQEEFRRWFRQNPNQDEKSEDYFFSPDPYRERQERGRNVIPEDILPNEIRSEINFGSGILLDEQGHIATVIELVDDSEEDYYHASGQHHTLTLKWSRLTKTRGLPCSKLIPTGFQ